MKYEKFRIRNFKGIKDTIVDLTGQAGSSIFAFVGLNESGKTTVLEAIYSFSPDGVTSDLLGSDTDIGVPVKDRVPRHQISSFSGDVSVEATISISSKEKTSFSEAMLERHALTVDLKTLPCSLVFERKETFKDGDLEGSSFILHTLPMVKAATERKWRAPTEDEATKIRQVLYNDTPDIAYFPTFVFDFPEKIYLTARGDELDDFYRGVFQDILDFDGRGFTIEKDIVRRIRNPDMTIPWLKFFSLWTSHDNATKIQHVMDRAGAAVTKVVFGRWNRIFGEDVRGKEIVITFNVAEGEVSDVAGNISKTNEHDVFIKFQIRDGTRRFDVNDRSLGFRWFFAFMLFTQFRVASTDARPVLFLFDEPASNLHAAAQQKLIDCFPSIAQTPNALAYTTHSHYMVEPRWLEQTFIVTNRSDSPPSAVLDAVSLDDESLDVQVSPYRKFVQVHPTQTSYFQPILDRLEVVPSRLDIQRSSIILEGKSDYYIIRYATQLLKVSDLPLVPGLGAGTFNSLISIHLGWNLKFFFLLDSDKQGKLELERYRIEYGLPADHIVTLEDLVKNAKEIEDLVDDEGRQIIAASLGVATRLTKKMICGFFQERLASNSVVGLGSGFEQKSRALLDALRERLNKA